MNKRKVLDAARKHAQKGAKQKALKEYEKLLAADPRDAKLLLEVGDAYRRWGEVEDAIGQYNKVAAQFRQDGFDARAVAVYKQILNLDPKRYATYVSLGELYQHMGLDSEAIGSLQTAADGYHKDGDKPKALDLLRKMAALDPSNTTSRMKVADLLKQEGMNEDAVTEYREVAEELKRQGEHDGVPVVLERILEIKPDSVDALSSLADCYMELSRADRAEPFAVKLAEIDADSAAFERLCSIYRALSDDEKLADATRSLAKLYRDRGDEDHAREIMQRLPTEAVVEAGGLGSDQSELEEPVLSDDELIDDDEFLLGDEEGDDDGELSLDQPAKASEAAPEVTTPELPEEQSSSALEISEGDPDQLFAEATVYLRYGKIEQAVASLKGILVQQPGHRGALEKLGEAMVEKGDEKSALANWRRAAELAAEAGDAPALDLLRDRVASLDPSVASELPVLDSAPAPEEEAADDFEFDLDLDIDTEDEPIEAQSDDATDSFEIDLGEGGEGLELAIDEAASSAGDDSEDEEDDAFEIDLDGDDLGLDDEAEPVVTNASEEPDPAHADESDDLGFDVDVDIDFETDEDETASDEAGDAGFDLDLDIDDPAADDVPPTSTSESDGSESTTARINEELEEAEFYLKQDLHSEAETIYRRILDIAPGHPSALLRLGEIAARKGQDPADVSHPDIELPEDEAIDIDQAALEIGLDDASMELDVGPDDEPVTGRSDESEDELQVEQEGEQEDEAEDSTEVALLDDAAMADPVAPANPLLSEEMADAALADASLGLDFDTDASAHAADGLEAPMSSEDVVEPIAAASDDDSFDLAAELAGAFEEANAADEPTDASETGEVLSKVEDGFESIFSDFKKGVSAALEEGDYETRYDLGIAYREMGLYEDAIAEFRVCLDSTHRRLESLHLMGLSAYDLGRFSDAVNHFEQALSTPELEESRKVGVYFDLGRAHEAAGDLSRAEGVYREVVVLDAAFPGIDARLEAVISGGGETPIELASEPSGELESFGDLFSDDEDDSEDVEAAPAESFESFDDFITDVEAEDDEDEPVAEAVMELEPEAEEEPQPDPGASGRRKKKISFV